jgi:hypothetical protein
MKHLRSAVLRLLAVGVHRRSCWIPTEFDVQPESSKLLFQIHIDFFTEKYGITIGGNRIV